MRRYIQYATAAVLGVFGGLLITNEHPAATPIESDAVTDETFSLLAATDNNQSCTTVYDVDYLETLAAAEADDDFYFAGCGGLF